MCKSIYKLSYVNQSHAINIPVRRQSKLIFAFQISANQSYGIIIRVIRILSIKDFPASPPYICRYRIVHATVAVLLNANPISTSTYIYILQKLLFLYGIYTFRYIFHGDYSMSSKMHVLEAETHSEVLMVPAFDHMKANQWAFIRILHHLGSLHLAHINNLIILLFYRCHKPTLWTKFPDYQFLN